jgi:hypothetical protein
VFVNGRELTQDEVDLLASAGVPVAPGDWWLNSQGQYGAVGSDVVLGTLPIGGRNGGNGLGGHSVFNVFQDPSPSSFRSMVYQLRLFKRSSHNVSLISIPEMHVTVLRYQRRCTILRVLFDLRVQSSTDSGAVSNGGGYVVPGVWNAVLGMTVPA